MATYNGTAARNVWNGTSSADTARGNGGDDSLYGKAGNDTLYGDAGNDGLYGDDGNDTLYGGDGVDALWGGAGGDTIRAGNGDDYVVGGIGDDGLYGDAGRDRLRGEDGVDALFGGSEDDDLDGGRGNDYLDGGTGNDTILGGLGDDRLRGGDGNDKFIVSGESDDVRGGNGNDNIIMETGGVLHQGDAFYFGDAGTDTLTIHMHGITPYGSDVPQPTTMYVRGETADRSGTFGLFDERMLDEIQMGELGGIEKLSVVPGYGTSLRYVGGNKAATVIGAEGDDVFWGGIGAETFHGGQGRDQFFIEMVSGETDRLTGFDSSDAIVTTLWEDSQGNDIARRTITETNGHTIVTTKSFSGTVLHTLDIDAVGLPRDIFKDGFAWDGFQV